MNKPNKHLVRILGGTGTVVLIYGSLRSLENKPAIFFIVVWCLLSYALGFLLDRSEYP